MRNSLILLIIVISGFSAARAQDVHISLLGGASNYMGDLQPKKFTLEQAHAAFGAGLNVELSEHWMIRLHALVAKVSGSDKGSLNADRNLSFSTPITEVMLAAEYDLFSLYERSLTPFAYAGIAGYKFDPSALDATGKKVALQPLGTEGQGFYLGRKKYSLTQMAIPIGGGLKMALNDDIRLRFELGLRVLMTDYLDDVSDTYADRAQLLAANGAKAVEMAFRGYEVKPTLIYPPAGSKRGNPKIKDFYYYGGLGLSFRLGSGSGGGGGGKKSKLGCPVNVY